MMRDRPDLALVRANLHGACSPCNNRRNKKRIGELDLQRAEALEFFA